MPYLQVDLPAPAGAAAKQRFARALAELYATAMETRANIPAIAFRELGPGNLVRLQDGELRAVLVIMCDIRRGRPAEQRETFARTIATLAAEVFEIDVLQVVVEFTQHTPDEMFRYGAIAPEWSPHEASAGP